MLRCISIWSNLSAHLAKAPHWQTGRNIPKVILNGPRTCRHQEWQHRASNSLRRLLKPGPCGLFGQYITYKDSHGGV
eukprot:2206298-Pleurochrysis_carterae.AAC.1